MSSIPTTDDLAAMSDSAAQALVDEIGFPPDRAAQMRSLVGQHGQRLVSDKTIQETAATWRANMMRGARAKRAELTPSPTIAHPRTTAAPKAPRVMTTRLQVTLPVDVVQTALDLHARGLLVDLLRSQNASSVQSPAPVPPWLTGSSNLSRSDKP